MICVLKGGPVIDDLCVERWPSERCVLKGGPVIGDDLCVEMWPSDSR